LIKNSCYSIAFIIININLLLSQTVDKVIISGWGGQHDLDVKNSFYLGYSSYDSTEFLGEVILYSQSLQNSFEYAEQNDYNIIIRSAIGLASGILIAPDYPSIILFMPSGSNSFVQAFSGDLINSPVIVTGAGVDSNVTGYKLDFYSVDPITEGNASSFSNGYVAGQLAFIANSVQCSLDSARVLARSTGSENGLFDQYSGFGRIITENILTDPLPVELSSFTAKVFNNDILLNWQTETEVNNYGFDIERKISSQDWIKIGFAEGYGNSNSPKKYSFKDDKLVGASKFRYRLKQVDTDGTFTYSDEVEVVLIPTENSLIQNYPNPFNPSTTLRFILAYDDIVSINIYSVLGEKVINLTNKYFTAGVHEIEFNGSELPSGIYLYTFIVGKNGTDHSETKKMMLLK